MQRIQHNGLAWYTFDGPDRCFHHALITRQGGVSQPPFAGLNLGHSVGDAADAVGENHRRLFAALGVSAGQVVSPHQVHGRQVARVTIEDGGKVIPETDGLISNTPELALLLRFADCTPVLFYDPEHRAAGLAHAGWRGVACGVIPATVQAMTDAFGTQPSHLWAGVGPAIGPDHYEVGSDVIEAIQANTPLISTRQDDRWFLDMPAVVEAQLRELGIANVEQARMCTACNTAEWYSHRQEKGRTGRFGVLVRLAP
ncbi:MAG: peptidoglycan editing factor PgeF [Anaerolineae bacterium]|nr:peptidoglycan editing factor PgeF [Anaerolineae bacterium]